MKKQVRISHWGVILDKGGATWVANGAIGGRDSLCIAGCFSFC